MPRTDRASRVIAAPPGHVWGRGYARRHSASVSTFSWVVGYEQARAVRGQIAADSKTRLAVDRYSGSPR